jgi:hypothetical protein
VLPALVSDWTSSSIAVRGLVVTYPQAPSDDFAGPIDLQLQRGVVPALPMQDQLDEAAFDAYHDLMQCRAQDPFARFRCRSQVRVY